MNPTMNLTPGPATDARKNAAESAARMGARCVTTFETRAALIFLLVLMGLLTRSFAVAQDVSDSEPLKQLSLAQLGNVEVTTASKEPEEVWRTPAAVFV